jgi:hypothetical protein
LFNRFPKLDLVILVDSKRIDCEAVGQRVKSKSKIPIVALSPLIGKNCRSADHNLSSHEPEALLELIRSLLGDPRRQDESQSQEAEAQEA